MTACNFGFQACRPVDHGKLWPVSTGARSARARRIAGRASIRFLVVFTLPSPQKARPGAANGIRGPHRKLQGRPSDLCQTRADTLDAIEHSRAPTRVAMRQRITLEEQYKAEGRQDKRSEKIAAG